MVEIFGEAEIKSEVQLLTGIKALLDDEDEEQEVLSEHSGSNYSEDSEFKRVEKYYLQYSVKKSKQSKLSEIKKKIDVVQNRETAFMFLEDYKPLSNLVKVEEIRQSEHFQIQKQDESLYIGEVKEGKREGKGIMLYKSGRIYEGNFKNDLRDEKGFEKYANGNTYVGGYRKGKAHFQGVYKWLARNEQYEGEFYQGLKHGYGTWSNQLGEQYAGQWRNSRPEGYGVHTWANSDKYEGEWRDCLKHGRGKDTFANGDRYEGDYEQGKFSGKGFYVWLEGPCYQGGFKDGLKHGRGKWLKDSRDTVQCNQYRGEYEFDVKCGIGTFRWASGSLYKGEFSDDDREGFGEMRWTDGSQYIGQWVKGVQNGFGRITLPDGTCKEGFFQQNVYRGPMIPEDFDITKITSQLMASGKFNKKGKPANLKKLKDVIYLICEEIDKEVNSFQ